MAVNKVDETWFTNKKKVPSKPPSEFNTVEFTQMLGKT